jgi:hypothetical protein
MVYIRTSGQEIVCDNGVSAAHSTFLGHLQKGYLVVRCWQDPSEPPSSQNASPSKESTTPPNSGSLNASVGDETRRRVRLLFEVEDTGTGEVFRF